LAIFSRTTLSKIFSAAANATGFAVFVPVLSALPRGPKANSTTQPLSRCCSAAW
jgi:hypothetical protein